MARKLPPEHSRFKKGQVGNPRGAGAHNPALKALKHLTIVEYREVIELALTSNLGALKAIADSQTASAVQVGVARALHKALKAGDFVIVEALAQRLVGKIPDKLEVNNNVTQNLSVSFKKPDPQIEEPK